MSILKGGDDKTPIDTGGALNELLGTAGALSSQVASMEGGMKKQFEGLVGEVNKLKGEIPSGEAVSPVQMDQFLYENRDRIWKLGREIKKVQSSQRQGKEDLRRTRAAVLEDLDIHDTTKQV